MVSIQVELIPRFESGEALCYQLHTTPPNIPLQIGIIFTENVSHLDEMA